MKAHKLGTNNFTFQISIHETWTNYYQTIISNVVSIATLNENNKSVTELVKELDEEISLHSTPKGILIKEASLSKGRKAIQFFKIYFEGLEVQ